jgi:flagellar biosynthetic protein FliR
MLDDASFKDYIILLLVFARITGAILFNPLLGRKNIPAMARVGLSIALTLCVFPLLDRPDTGIDTAFEFIFAALKELFVGFTIGFIMQLVMSAVFTAGESVDMQLGTGMSKIYDPSSNISMALSGTIYNLVLTMLFFLSNGHLTLIRLIFRSCMLFPVGVGFINFDGGRQIVLIFGDILLLALKIAMPIIAAELLAEAGLGILMRSVSHINIFSIGLHIRLVVGFAILVMSLPTVSRLLDNSVTYMFEKINTGIEAMLTP